MRRLILPVLLIVGVGSCAPTHVIQPTPVTVENVRQEEQISEKIPFYLTDFNFWNYFWRENWRNTGGVTICYGRTGVVISINPMPVPDSVKLSSWNHEHIHKEQVERYTCPMIVAMNQTPRGQAILEAEAFSRSDGLRGEELIDRLMMYGLVRTLSREQVKEIIIDFY